MRQVGLAPLALGEFLTFMALKGPKKSLTGNLSAYSVHDIFLVWGGDAPNPLHYISFHSALPAFQAG